MNIKSKLEENINYSIPTTTDQSLISSIIQRTFIWLGIILAIVFGTGLLITSQGILLSPILFWGSIITGLGLVVAISWFYTSMNYLTLSILAIIFGIVEGIGISGVFNTYTSLSIMSSFLGASILFFLMAIYGYTTKRDLTKLGTIAFIGLIAVIILTLINIFILHSSMLEIGLSILGIIIFLGFTAYDLKLLKEMANTGDRRLEIVFGLSLFLDFINIFLNLLQLFGNEE